MNLKKEEALKLRKIGKSYREISLILKVPRSTLSYWLNKVELSTEQKLLLIQKQHQGRIKGAQIRRAWRISREQQILERASQEISRISERELGFLGAIAYWCEGSKQKAHSVSTRVIFTNSDPFLIKLFVKWVMNFCKISEDRLIYNLCIHETGDIEAVLNYWYQTLGISKERFSRTVLKKHKISTNRKYNNSLYFGLMRVTVRNSTDLNRQIKGWVLGINSLLS